MMKKRIIAFIVGFSFVLPTLCQNSKRIEFDIENAMKNFFSDITSMAKPVDASNPELFAKDYQGNYFFYNGNKSTVLNFLNSYKRSIGADYYIHKFQNTSISRKDNETNLYVVEGLLRRNHITQEDYKIKDEKVKLEVYWEDGEYANVKIMRIDMPTKVAKVFPKFSDKYSFNILKATSHIASTGGKWNVIVDSWKWKEKEYPGISKEPERYDSLRVSFDVSPNNSLFNRGRTLDVDAPSNSFGDELKANYSKETRKIHLTFVQKESGNNAECTIIQDGKEVIDPFGFNLTSIYYLMDIKAHYAPKLGGGVSCMVTPEDSRWSFGLLFITNGNSFRDLFSGKDWSSSSSVSVSTSTYIDITDGEISINPGGNEKGINGYKITETTYDPENENYEEVENYANNDIDRYTAKLLLLANTGCFINNWSRLDLGIGAVRKRDFSHYNKAYEIKKYSYVKSSSDLPDISDVYEPIGTKEGIWNKKKSEWRFAVRPAIDFFVPLGEDFHISAGLGYTIVFNATNLSSLDFNLGIAFNL